MAMGNPMIHPQATSEMPNWTPVQNEGGRVENENVEPHVREKVSCPEQNVLDDCLARITVTKTSKGVKVRAPFAIYKQGWNRCKARPSGLYCRTIRLGPKLEISA